MLKLEHVYKRFGTHLAVNDLSFTLNAGEIVGLLGPNGAGKTTTMRLIASYFFPDAGKIYVADHQTSKQTLLTQADIGYLPENNPLYLDMLVIDFLLLTWGLNTTPKQKVSTLEKLKKIKTLATSVNLDKKLMTRIGDLSKGYKQRVGLAAALLTEPKVLILDEPTEGLDPNERQEIRSLIKKLAAGRVILISTHVLQEVKALCTKAIIINSGQLVAMGDPHHLGNRFTYTLELEGEKIEPEIRQLLQAEKKKKAVNGATENSSFNLEIKDKKAKIKQVTISAHRELRPELNALAAKNKWTIWSLNMADELDHIFQTLK